MYIYIYSVGSVLSLPACVFGKINCMCFREDKACVCVKERETVCIYMYMSSHVYMYLNVCTCVKERERERESFRIYTHIVKCRLLLLLLVKK